MQKEIDKLRTQLSTYIKPVAPQPQVQELVPYEPPDQTAMNEVRMRKNLVAKRLKQYATNPFNGLKRPTAYKLEKECLTLLSDNYRCICKNNSAFHFPKIVRSDDQSMTFILTNQGQSLDKLRGTFPPTILNIREQIACICFNLSQNKIRNLDVHASGKNLCITTDGTISMIDFDIASINDTYLSSAIQSRAIRYADYDDYLKTTAHEIEAICLAHLPAVIPATYFTRVCQSIATSIKASPSALFDPVPDSTELISFITSANNIIVINNDPPSQPKSLVLTLTTCMVSTNVNVRADILIISALTNYTFKMLEQNHAMFKYIICARKYKILQNNDAIHPKCIYINQTLLADLGNSAPIKRCGIKIGSSILFLVLIWLKYLYDYSFEGTNKRIDITGYNVGSRNFLEYI